MRCTQLIAAAIPIQLDLDPEPLVLYVLEPCDGEIIASVGLGGLTPGTQFCRNCGHVYFEQPPKGSYLRRAPLEFRLKS